MEDSTTIKIHLKVVDSKPFADGVKRTTQEAADIIKRELEKAYEQMNKKTEETEENTKKTALNLKDIAKNAIKAGLNLIKVVSTLVLLEGALLAVSAFTTLFVGAMGIVKQENQEIVNKMAYLKAMLQSAYRALVDIATKFMNWILDGIIKVAYWIDYIVQKWFGISLLEKSGEEYEKNMKNAANSAKEIRKQLMGFDEANVLTDTSSSSSNTSTGLKPTAWKPEQIDVPDWVKWIAENKDTIITVAEIVGVAFAGVKTIGILNNIAKIFGTAGAAGAVGGTGLAGLFTSLAAIAAIAASIIIVAICAKKVWDDLQNLEAEMIKIRDLNKEINREETKNLDPNKDLAKLKNKMSVHQQSIAENIKNAHKWTYKILGLEGQMYENIKETIISSQTELDKLKEMYDVEGATKEQKEDILQVMKDQYDMNLLGIEALEQQGYDVSQLKEINQQYYDEIKQRQDEINEDAKQQAKEKEDAWKNLKDTALGVLKNIQDYKIGDKTFNLKGILSSDIAKNLVNAYDNVQKHGGLQAFALQIFNPLINKLRKTYSATGSIVNLPGHGVPVGNNVWAGEAGREGVIPLTDPHAMSELGAEIGKWVNISLQNNMLVDGQVLATATNDRVSKERFLMNR